MPHQSVTRRGESEWGIDVGVALAAGVLGVILSGVGTLAYLRDILHGSTVPHRGSWLVWSAIAVVATAAHAAGGARWSLLVLAVQAGGNLAVLLLAVRRGVGGVTRGNVVLMVVAAAGVTGWVLLEDPLAAAAGAALADGAGLLAILPKVWADPFSETALTYGLAGVTGLLAVVSADSLDLTLLLFPGYYCLANAFVAQVIDRRRRAVLRGGARVHDRVLDEVFEGVA